MSWKLEMYANFLKNEIPWPVTKQQLIEWAERELPEILDYVLVIPDGKYKELKEIWPDLALEDIENGEDEGEEIYEIPTDFPE